MDDNTTQLRDGLETKLSLLKGLLEVQEYSGSEGGQNRARQRIKAVELDIAAISA